MMHQSIFTFSILLVLLHCTAQSPAPAPASPAGPTNVIKILKKADQFKTLIRLLKSTQLDSNLNSQLGNTNNGLTMFAPSDSAFSSLKQGTLKSLTSQQKLELMQFHIIPVFISTSKFDTVSNPLKTHAGTGGRFQLNVTTSGSTVNISTGLTNTTIADTVYIDSHLAIYKVDKVLLPLDIFTPKPVAPVPAPAPATKKTKLDKESSYDDHDGNSDSKDTSGGVSLFMKHRVLVSIFGVGILLLH